MSAFNDRARQDKLPGKLRRGGIGLPGIIDSKQYRFPALLAANSEIPTVIFGVGTSGKIHKSAQFETESD